VDGGVVPADHLSTTFAALADPTRRAILARLASGETSVSDLAEPFDMSLPAVSQAPEGTAASWIEEYRRHWERSLDRLDDYLHQLHAKSRPRKRRQTR
jgi:hypothetical protein